MKKPNKTAKKTTSKKTVRKTRTRGADVNTVAKSMLDQIASRTETRR